MFEVKMKKFKFYSIFLKLLEKESLLGLLCDLLKNIRKFIMLLFTCYRKILCNKESLFIIGN